MADFYNLADQKLFKDYQFLPQEKYRLGLNLPTDATEDEVVTDQGIVNTNAFANAGGGGDNFSVYNPDPNTIVNQNYDDRPYQTALYNNSFPMMGDPEANIATGALNADGSMSYAGDDDEELTGIRSLISKGVNLIPGMGMLRTGAQAIGSLLPTNQRAIMENEAAGYGVNVNDIGQIVGDPRTIGGSMAGYNLNNLTDKSFSKRQDTIEETMRENYGYTDEDIDNLKNGIVTESMKQKSINPTMSKTYGVPTMTNLVQDFINRNAFQDRLKDIITKTNIVYANENYDPSIETPVGADTITGPDINEDPNPDGDGPGYTGPPTTDYNPNVEVTGPDYGPYGGGDGDGNGGSGDNNSPDNSGVGGGIGTGYCFDPSTPIQMADGSTKEIKNIQLGDNTKGGEVTGVFQFKAADEIHDYKGVTVAGGHYVKEDGKFIMVKDSPLAVKIDKIPVVYSLDTTARRIFIKDIEFADYNGDGVAKNFLSNAGVDLSGFDKEVLRQVENRLI